MAPQDTLEQMREKISKQLKGAKYSIVILEGFLLYHISDILTRLDGKLFIRLDHQEARRRRLTRPSYGSEAQDGEFWKTEDYFEKIVWRNYVEQHAHLFEDGNVEGSIDKKVCREKEIVVQESMNMEIVQTLAWAVGVVITLLEANIG